MVRSIYTRAVLDRPKTILTLVLLVSAFFAWHIPRFELDASSDSLLLEGDKDLHDYLQTRRQYPSDDYLVVTFSPEGDLFSPESLAVLEALTDDLGELERVSSVFSILDAPLLQSPKVPLFMLASGYKTLRKKTADIELARIELTESPLFGNFLIAEDDCGFISC